jgi:putative transposase
MRCLNEHIARLANQENGCKGRFCEGRYKFQALIDERALLICMAYVDLNPIRTKLANTPEASDFTRMQERIQAFSRTDDEPSLPLKKLHHLLEFGCDESLNRSDNTTPFHLYNYIALMDWTGRAIRNDKRGSIPQNLVPVLNAKTWTQTIGWQP